MATHAKKVKHPRKRKPVTVSREVIEYLRWFHEAVTADWGAASGHMEAYNREYEEETGRRVPNPYRGYMNAED